MCHTRACDGDDDARWWIQGASKHENVPHNAVETMSSCSLNFGLVEMTSSDVKRNTKACST